MRIVKRIAWVVSGLFLGLFSGYILAIGLLGISWFLFGEAWKYIYVVRLVGLFLFVICTVGGVWLGATSKRKRKPTKAILQLSPDLEQAARARFNPSTLPLESGPDSEGRIARADEPLPDHPSP